MIDIFFFIFENFVICSSLAQSISQCGAKVALLDLHLDSAQKYADEIFSKNLSR